MKKKVLTLFLLTLILGLSAVGLGLKKYNAELNRYNSSAKEKHSLLESVKDKEMEYTDKLVDAKQTLINYGYIQDEEINSKNTQEQIDLINNSMNKYLAVELNDTQLVNVEENLSNYYKTIVQEELSLYPMIKSQVSAIEVQSTFGEKFIVENYLTDMDKLVNKHSDKISVKINLKIKDNNFKESYQDDLKKAIDVILGDIKDKSIHIN